MDVPTSNTRRKRAPLAGLGSLPGFLLRRILLAAGHDNALLAGIYARRCSPRVLIVGDGDFSFARALTRIRARRKGLFGLCNNLVCNTRDVGACGVGEGNNVICSSDCGGSGSSSGPNKDSSSSSSSSSSVATPPPMLCATSYDSRADLEKKYGSAGIGSILRQLDEDAGVRVVHGVDATDMDAGAIGDGYDLIVFNFPKVDATSREEFRIAGRVPRNRYLIAGFLVSAARLINEKTGTVMIAQKIGSRLIQ